MDWQEVRTVGRADARTHRAHAEIERANAADCAHAAQSATDSDSAVLWLLRAIQQHSAAANSEAAAEVSDRIADHAGRVLSDTR